MILKSGTAYPENDEPKDAIWEYSEGNQVVIGFADDASERCLVSIDATDLLAIADAIKGNILFNQTKRNENNNRATR